MGTSWITNGIANFIQLTKQSVLWTLATALFLPSLYFASSMFQELPIRMGEFDRSSIRFEAYTSEHDKAGRLYAALSSAVAAFVRINTLYREKIAGRPASDELEPALILNGLLLVADARDALARAIGAIEGTSFEDARLQKYKAGLERDLSQIGELTMRWQKFYSLHQQGEKEEALRVAKSMNEPAITQAAEAMLTRQKDFRDVLLRTLRENTQDVVEQHQKRSVYSVKTWLAMLSVIYVFSFVAAAGWVVLGRRPSRKKR